MTKTGKTTVLYVNHEDNVIGGSSRSLDNLIMSVKEYVTPIILLRSEGPVADFFRSRGYECIVHPFRRLTYKGGVVTRTVRFLPHLVTNTLINHRCVKDVCKALSGRNVDIVHSNSGVIDIGLALAEKLDAKHVWHIREYFDLGLNARPFLGFRRWNREIRRSDAVILISNGLREHLGLVDSPSAFCFPDAVRSKDDVVLDTVKEKYFLFCAGEMGAVKRPETAIRAFGKSGLAEKGYSLLFTGNCRAEREAELMLVAKESGVADKVRFLGYVPDIKPLMSKATAYLMCSEFEGLGRVTIEAMFYGCPVIARRSGGTLEIISDRRNGFFFDTVEECSELMNMLASALPLDVVREAQKDAVSRYSEEEYGREIMRVYNNLTR